MSGAARRGSGDTFIRMMEPGDPGRLRAIDIAATRLLADAGWPDLPGAPPLDHYARWLLAHEVFVAERGGWPVGFACARDLLPGPGEAAGSCFWLAELSVDPDHGRRGIGSALLEAVLERARWCFHRAVGLTTFRDVPFNAPFYARRGFLQVPRGDWTNGLAERFGAELPPGVAAETRVLMVKWL